MDPCASREKKTNRPDFWNDIISKYESHNSELAKKQDEMRQRVESMECSMPALFCFNMMQSSLSEPDRKLRDLVSRIHHIPSSDNMNDDQTQGRTTSEKIPTDFDSRPVKDLANEESLRKVDGTSSMCSCDIKQIPKTSTPPEIQTSIDLEIPICQCDICKMSAGDSQQARNAPDDTLNCDCTDPGGPSSAANKEPSLQSKECDSNPSLNSKSSSCKDHVSPSVNVRNFDATDDDEETLYAKPSFCDCDPCQFFNCPSDSSNSACSCGHSPSSSFKNSESGKGAPSNATQPSKTDEDKSDKECSKEIALVIHSNECETNLQETNAPDINTIVSTNRISCKCSHCPLVVSGPQKIMLSNFTSTKTSDFSCTCSSDTSRHGQQETVFNFEYLSSLSVTSEDVEHIEKIKHLVQTERKLKHEINELQHKEDVYVKTLKQTDDMWRAEDTCASDSKNLKDCNRELQRRNGYLRDEVKRAELELKRTKENFEDPIRKQLAQERGKSRKLEAKFRSLTSNQYSAKSDHCDELDFLTKQLQGANQNLNDLHLVNKRLKEELCVLNYRSEELQADLINQKLSEIHTVSRLAAMEQMQSSARTDDEVWASGEGGSKEDLDTIARNLSNLLAEAEECSKCKTIPPNLIETVKCIKSLVDLLTPVRRKSCTRRESQDRHGSEMVESKPTLEIFAAKKIRSSQSHISPDEEIPSAVTIKERPSTKQLLLIEPTGTKQTEDTTEQPIIMPRISYVEQLETAPEPIAAPEATKEDRELFEEVVEFERKSPIVATEEKELEALEPEKIAEEQEKFEIKDEKTELVLPPVTEDEAPQQLEEGTFAEPSETEEGPTQEREEEIERAFIQTIVRDLICRCKPELNGPCNCESLTETSEDGEGEGETVMRKCTEGVYVTTTTACAGVLEVITESPDTVIETTLKLTESGNIEVVTEVTEFEEEAAESDVREEVAEDKTEVEEVSKEISLKIIEEVDKEGVPAGISTEVLKELLIRDISKEVQSQEQDLTIESVGDILKRDLGDLVEASTLKDAEDFGELAPAGISTEILEDLLIKDIAEKVEPKDNKLSTEKIADVLENDLEDILEAAVIPGVVTVEEQPQSKGEEELIPVGISTEVLKDLLIREISKEVQEVQPLTIETVEDVLKRSLGDMVEAATVKDVDKLRDLGEELVPAGISTEILIKDIAEKVEPKDKQLPIEKIGHVLESDLEDIVKVAVIPGVVTVEEQPPREDEEEEELAPVAISTEVLKDLLIRDISKEVQAEQPLTIEIVKGVLKRSLGDMVEAATVKDVDKLRDTEEELVPGDVSTEVLQDLLIKDITEKVKSKDKELSMEIIEDVLETDLEDIVEAAVITDTVAGQVLPKEEEEEVPAGISTEVLKDLLIREISKEVETEEQPITMETVKDVLKRDLGSMVESATVKDADKLKDMEEELIPAGISTEVLEDLLIKDITERVDSKDAELTLQMIKDILAKDLEDLLDAALIIDIVKLKDEDQQIRTEEEEEDVPAGISTEVLKDLLVREISKEVETEEQPITIDTVKDVLKRDLGNMVETATVKDADKLKDMGEDLIPAGISTEVLEDLLIKDITERVDSKDAELTLQTIKDILAKDLEDLLDAALIIDIVKLKDEDQQIRKEEEEEDVPAGISTEVLKDLLIRGISKEVETEEQPITIETVKDVLKRDLGNMVETATVKDADKLKDMGEDLIPAGISTEVLEDLLIKDITERVDSKDAELTLQMIKDILAKDLEDLLDAAVIIDIVKLKDEDQQIRKEEEEEDVPAGISTEVLKDLLIRDISKEVEKEEQPITIETVKDVLKRDLGDMVEAATVKDADKLKDIGAELIPAGISTEVLEDLLIKDITERMDSKDAELTLQMIKDILAKDLEDLLDAALIIDIVKLKDEDQQIRKEEEEEDVPAGILTEVLKDLLIRDISKEVEREEQPITIETVKDVLKRDLGDMVEAATVKDADKLKDIGAELIPAGISTEVLEDLLIKDITERMDSKDAELTLQMIKDILTEDLEDLLDVALIIEVLKLKDEEEERREEEVPIGISTEVLEYLLIKDISKEMQTTEQELTIETIKDILTRDLGELVDAAIIKEAITSRDGEQTEARLGISTEVLRDLLIKDISQKILFEEELTMDVIRDALKKDLGQLVEAAMVEPIFDIPMGVKKREQQSMNVGEIIMKKERRESQASTISSVATSYKRNRKKFKLDDGVSYKSEAIVDEAVQVEEIIYETKAVEEPEVVQELEIPPEPVPQPEVIPVPKTSSAVSDTEPKQILADIIDTIMKEKYMEIQKLGLCLCRKESRERRLVQEAVQSEEEDDSHLIECIISEAIEQATKVIRESRSAEAQISEEYGICTCEEEEISVPEIQSICTCTDDVDTKSEITSTAKDEGYLASICTCSEETQFDQPTRTGGVDISESTISQETVEKITQLQEDQDEGYLASICTCSEATQFDEIGIDVSKREICVCSKDSIETREIDQKITRDDLLLSKETQYERVQIGKPSTKETKDEGIQGPLISTCTCMKEAELEETVRDGTGVDVRESKICKLCQCPEFDEEELIKAREDLMSTKATEFDFERKCAYMEKISSIKVGKTQDAISQYEKESEDKCQECEMNPTFRQDKEEEKRDVQSQYEEKKVETAEIETEVEKALEDRETETRVQAVEIGISRSETSERGEEAEIPKGIDIEIQFKTTELKDETDQTQESLKNLKEVECYTDTDKREKAVCDCPDMVKVLKMIYKDKDKGKKKADKDKQTICLCDKRMKSTPDMVAIVKAKVCARENKSSEYNKTNKKGNTYYAIETAKKKEATCDCDKTRKMKDGKKIAYDPTRTVCVSKNSIRTKRDNESSSENDSEDSTSESTSSSTSSSSENLKANKKLSCRSSAPKATTRCPNLCSKPTQTSKTIKQKTTHSSVNKKVPLEFSTSSASNRRQICDQIRGTSCEIVSSNFSAGMSADSLGNNCRNTGIQACKYTQPKRNFTARNRPITSRTYSSTYTKQYTKDLTSSKSTQFNNKGGYRETTSTRYEKKWYQEVKYFPDGEIHVDKSKDVQVPVEIKVEKSVQPEKPSEETAPEEAARKKDASTVSPPMYSIPDIAVPKTHKSVTIGTSEADKKIIEDTTRETGPSSALQRKKSPIFAETIEKGINTLRNVQKKIVAGLSNLKEELPKLCHRSADVADAEKVENGTSMPESSQKEEVTGEESTREKSRRDESTVEEMVKRESDRKELEKTSSPEICEHATDEKLDLKECTKLKIPDVSNEDATCDAVDFPKMSAEGAPAPRSAGICTTRSCKRYLQSTADSINECIPGKSTSESETPVEKFESCTSHEIQKPETSTCTPGTCKNYAARVSINNCIPSKSTSESETPVGKFESSTSHEIQKPETSTCTPGTCKDYAARVSINKCTPDRSTSESETPVEKFESNTSHEIQKPETSTCTPGTCKNYAARAIRKTSLSAPAFSRFSPKSSSPKLNGEDKLISVLPEQSTDLNNVASSASTYVTSPSTPSTSKTGVTKIPVPVTCTNESCPQRSHVNSSPCTRQTCSRRTIAEAERSKSCDCTTNAQVDQKQLDACTLETCLKKIIQIGLEPKLSSTSKIPISKRSSTCKPCVCSGKTQCTNEAEPEICVTPIPEVNQKSDGRSSETCSLITETSSKSLECSCRRNDVKKVPSVSKSKDVPIHSCPCCSCRCLEEDSDITIDSELTPCTSETCRMSYILHSSSPSSKVFPVINEAGEPPCSCTISQKSEEGSLLTMCSSCMCKSVIVESPVVPCSSKTCTEILKARKISPCTSETCLKKTQDIKVTDVGIGTQKLAPCSAAKCSSKANQTIKLAHCSPETCAKKRKAKHSPEETDPTFPQSKDLEPRSSEISRKAIGSRPSSIASFTIDPCLPTCKKFLQKSAEEIEAQKVVKRDQSETQQEIERESKLTPDIALDVQSNQNVSRGTLEDIFGPSVTSENLENSTFEAPENIETGSSNVAKENEDETAEEQSKDANQLKEPEENQQASNVIKDSPEVKQFSQPINNVIKDSPEVKQFSQPINNVIKDDLRVKPAASNTGENDPEDKQQNQRKSITADSVKRGSHSQQMVEMNNVEEEPKIKHSNQILNNPEKNDAEEEPKIKDSDHILNNPEKSKATDVQNVNQVIATSNITDSNKNEILTGTMKNKKSETKNLTDKFIEESEKLPKPDNPMSHTNPGNLKNPVNPENSGNPSNRNPGNPIIANNPGNPGNPIIANNPGNPGNPIIANNPGNPGNPIIANNPGNPTIANNPGNPIIANNPGNPIIANNPGNPGNSSNSGELRNSKNVSHPENPGNPDKTNNLDHVGNPASLTNPANPGNTGNPGNPNYSEKPENKQANVERDFTDSSNTQDSVLDNPKDDDELKYKQNTKASDNYDADSENKKEGERSGNPGNSSKISSDSIQSGEKVFKEKSNPSQNTKTVETLRDPSAEEGTGRRPVKLEDQDSLQETEEGKREEVLKMSEDDRRPPPADQETSESAVPDCPKPSVEETTKSKVPAYIDKTGGDAAHPKECDCIDCLLADCDKQCNIEEHPRDCDCIDCLCNPCATKDVPAKPGEDDQAIKKEEFKHSPDCECLVCLCDPCLQPEVTPEREPPKETSDHLPDCDCIDCICKPYDLCLEAPSVSLAREDHPPDCFCEECRCKPLLNVCTCCKCDPCPHLPQTTKEHPPDCQCVECLCDPCKNPTKHHPDCQCPDCVCSACVDVMADCNCEVCACEACPDENAHGPNCDCPECSCESCGDPTVQRHPSECTCQICECELPEEKHSSSCTCVDCLVKARMPEQESPTKTPASSLPPNPIETIAEPPAGFFSGLFSNVVRTTSASCLTELITGFISNTLAQPPPLLPLPRKKEKILPECKCHPKCICEECTAKRKSGDECECHPQCICKNCTKIRKETKNVCMEPPKCVCGTNLAECKCLPDCVCEKCVARPIIKVCGCHPKCICKVCVAKRQAGDDECDCHPECVCEECKTKREEALEVCDCQPECICEECDAEHVSKKDDCGCYPECVCGGGAEAKHDEEECDCLPDCQCEECTTRTKTQGENAEDLQNQLKDMENENKLKQREIEELQVLLNQIKCSCADAEVQAARSSLPDLSKSPPKDLAGLQVALSTLQKKCESKDRMIEAMTQELRTRATSNIFSDMFKKISNKHQVNADFDRQEICNTLPRPKNDPKFGRPSHRLLQPVASNCVCDDSLKIKISEVKRITPGSILVKWTAPTSNLVIGYEICVNGVLKSRVHSATRTAAVVFTCDVKTQISIYAITQFGRCEPPAVASFNV